MIISSAHNFGFVHIPKNAGSTVRHQLRDYDDNDGAFFRVAEVEGYGRLNLNHVPLAILRDFFPEAFEALSKVKSYSMVRDPDSRFVSAVAQRMRDPLGREPADYTRAEIIEELADIRRHLKEANGFPSHDYVVFSKQTEYVDLEGARWVTEIWPVGALPAFMDQVEAEHGLKMMRDTVFNPTVTYRNPKLEKPLKAMKDVAKKALPVGLYSRLRDGAVSLFTTRGVPLLNETITEDAATQAFLRDYYAADYALYAEALAAHGPAPAAAG